MQNFGGGMNDIMQMMQQFGGSNGMQRYMQAFQQLQSQNIQPGNMFQAYQQFRKNLGMKGEITQEQFQTLQNQANSIPQDQFNQIKSMVSGQASNINSAPQINQNPSNFGGSY